jgi:oligopeptide transport system permease protein
MSKIDKSQFEWVGANAAEAEKITRPSTSYWRDAMKRLKKNRAAMICLFIIIALIVLSVFVPIFSRILSANSI